MDINPSKRVAAIGSYAFDAVDKEVAKLQDQGITPIDFGVGDPTVPTPEFIRASLKEAVDRRATSGYPSYIGASEYRKAVADWTQKRFGLTLDPDTEICAHIGSKEAIFNFHEGLIDPGDLVIVPSPGYPPWTRGTQFAEGQVYYVPLRAENNFLIDLEAIPDDIAQKAKLIWVNYPNNPTGALATPAFYKDLIAWAKKFDIIIASDEAYTELYYSDEPPHTILEYGKEGIVAFNSLSKRSAMTGWRIGWMSGDKALVDIFKKVKTNIDSGVATFIQDAGITALSDETHVEAFREDYKTKRDILVSALTEKGLPECRPEGTIYIWQQVPEGYTSVDFATKLLDPEVALVTTPGAWISDTTESGENPGEGFVRFALVPSIENCKKAAEKIKNLQL